MTEGEKRAREQGYREAYDSGLRALGDMAVEVHRLVTEAEDKLEELKAQALEIVNITEGRAEKAKSLLEISAPVYPTGNPPPFAPAEGSAELCMFPKAPRSADDEVSF